MCIKDIESTNKNDSKKFAIRFCYLDLTQMTNFKRLKTNLTLNTLEALEISALEVMLIMKACIIDRVKNLFYDFKILLKKYLGCIKKN